MRVTPASVAARASAGFGHRAGVTGLGETGGDGDGGAHACIRALRDHIRQLLRADCQQSEVRLGRQLRQVGRDGESEELAAFGIHRVDVTLEPPCEDVLQRGAAPADHVAGCADNGDGPRRQHRVQVWGEGPCLRARGRSPRQHHQRVGRDGPSVVHEQWVHIDLGDLREVGGDPLDGLEDDDEHLPVHGGLSSERAQQSLAADEIGELRDIALGARGDGECDVAEHLGHGAAEAEGDDGTEGGVSAHADHELPAAGDHLLHQRGLERLTGPLRECGVGRRDFSLGPKTECDELPLRLVLDQSPDRLHGDGHAERGGEVGGLRRRADEAAGGDRNAVGGEDALGRGLVKRRTPCDERLLDDVARLRRRTVDVDWHQGTPFGSSAAVDDQLYRW